MLIATSLARAFGVVITDEEHHKFGRKCHSRLFSLHYTITDDALMIEGLEVTARGNGHGSKLVRLLWRLCEQYELDLYANIVLADAVDFWSAMGFERDPKDPINFVRRYQKQAA